ncbi:DHH family phosphoesterase [Cytobacillus purgationiresistens]|uniref:Oligoribonuclease NrnB/cAMP/cGMP phosphodiesterase (DHH superfamily) n=1 Tax=Cytobacillus purgationiresistens TaxID=863449 RepID=A0ABU0AB03_9BACI|nr:oligoribonuclease [Cytobacillus purgationiresistens]MDQ0268436.1 oligoribonuclease NrnB/cAMP/cGMP phosphodiesterase (DHH superfamily) [Cytobacillus purgationiresistens]
MYKLYSHNDLDGVGCGVVAKLAFGDEVNVTYNSVGGLDYQIEKFFEDAGQKNDDFLIITDLSINEENTERIENYMKNGGSAQLIDHHKSALHFNGYEWGKVQVNYSDGRQTSATSLLYEHLVENQLMIPSPTLEQFIELVRQYDTWEWDKLNNIKAKQLNDLFFMFSIDEFEGKIIQRVQQDTDFDFDEFEQKLLQMEDNKIERYIKRKKRELIQANIGDYCAGVVHAESYHSELGNELGKEYPHLDYIVILNMGGRKMSFRTIHDHVDVSEIAGQFGGGGHAKASGCSMGKEAFQLFVVDLFQSEQLRMDAPKNKLNVKENPNGVLYEGRSGDKYFIFVHAGDWSIDINRKKNSQTFSDYQDAVNHIKRSDYAWLVKDDIFEEYSK